MHEKKIQQGKLHPKYKKHVIGKYAIVLYKGKMYGQTPRG